MAVFIFCSTVFKRIVQIFPTFRRVRKDAFCLCFCDFRRLRKVVDTIISKQPLIFKCITKIKRHGLEIWIIDIFLICNNNSSIGKKRNIFFSFNRCLCSCYVRIPIKIKIICLIDCFCGFLSAFIGIDDCFIFGIIYIALCSVWRLQDLSSIYIPTRCKFFFQKLFKWQFT